MAITPLPPAPQTTDSPADFNSKAFAWVDSLGAFVTQANAQALQVDADAITATNAASTATSAANTATTKAGEALQSANNAAASALEAAGLVENYQGALASDPLVNKDGDPLQAGDWYVNTVTGLIRAYDGAQWVTSVNITSGVESFSAGTTGLTPSTGTQGDVVLAGTLGVANGGTGATSLTGVLKGNGTSAVTASNVDLSTEVTSTLTAVNGGTGLTSPGAAANVLTSNGTVWESQPPPATLDSIVVLTSGTSWTAPTGVKRIKARMVGGGGGGGHNGGLAGYAAGGGSGGYVEFFANVSSGTSYAYTIGSGGAAGLSNSNGSPGGNTTFTVGTTKTAGGGGGGRTSISDNQRIPGEGGSALNGDVNIIGTLGFGTSTQASVHPQGKTPSVLGNFGSGGLGGRSSRLPTAGGGGAIILELYK